MSSEAFIVDAVRTPIGRRNGALSRVRPDDLLASVIEALVTRTGVNPGDIEDVVAGCLTQVGEQSMNVAREAALIAGLPATVPGTVVERFCGSAQQAVHFGAAVVAAGHMDLVVAGGVESMSRHPLDSDVLANPDPYGDSAGAISPRLRERYEIIHQGIAANRLGLRDGISRSDQDAFALESHRRAVLAIDEGLFRDETIAITAPAGDRDCLVATDEGPRRDTSLDALAGLSPAFEPGATVTAGNSSQVSDAAAALLLASSRGLDLLSARPRARIRACVAVGCDPTTMFDGVVPATRRALERAELTVSDIDVFEVNEAFATVPLYWLQHIDADPATVNPNGGAIALGHPIGCTGARLITSCLYELERRSGTFGLITACIGHGMATATVLERMA